MSLRRVTATLTALVAAVVLTGCAGGASDSVALVGGPRTADGSGGTINLYAYAVAKVGFDALIPAFNATAAGRGVSVQQSYGPSGEQSRKVAAGAAADVVALSVGPDVTRLVGAGLVAPDWNAGPHQGVPFGSVVTIVVRKGNPKAITDWDDLLKPGVEVVTPNPFSSGSAKWNLLAPYAAKSEGGTNPAAGLAYIRSLVTDHVRIQPKSGREASEAFLQGSGDALLSYENEALFLERHGDPVQHVTPPSTFKIGTRWPCSGRAGTSRRPRPSPTISTRPRRRGCWPGPGSGSWTRAWQPSSRPASRRRRSSGRSPTSAAGRAWTAPCSPRRSAPSPSSTTRRRRSP